MGFTYVRVCVVCADLWLIHTGVITNEKGGYVRQREGDTWIIRYTHIYIHSCVHALLVIVRCTSVYVI